VEYCAGGIRLYGERLLVRLPTPLSRSRTVQETVYREAQVDWDSVAEEPGEVKEDEKSTISYLVTRHVLQPLRAYAAEASSHAPLPADVSIRITPTRRSTPPWALEAPVQRELNASRLRAEAGVAAAKCAERELGFRVVHPYGGGPSTRWWRGGLKYTVEVKGRWVGRRGGPLSFTADDVEAKGKSADKSNEPILFTENEIEWAREHPDTYLIYVAYVDGDQCTDVKYFTFAEFQKEWNLQKANCQYVAIPRSSQLPLS